MSARRRHLIAGGAAFACLLFVPTCTREGEIHEPGAFEDDSFSWCEAAPMREARYRPQVVELLDGRILAIAGRGAGANYLASAEIYDPTSNTWSAAGSLSTARYYHRAVRLTDGRVLVTGGVSPDGPLASAELYDPRTNAWTVVAPMAGSRREHAMFETAPGVVLVAGGGNPHVPILTSTERFDVATGTWVRGPDLPEGSANASVSAPLSDGTRYAVGGYGNDGYAAQHVLLYTPATAQWTSGPPLLMARDYPSVSIVGHDSLFIVGGFQGDSAVLATSEVFDPSANRWTFGPSLNIATLDHRALTLPGGRVLILGGLTKGFVTTARTEIYEPDKHAFALGPALHTRRYGFFAVRLSDGRVMIGGGAGNYGAVDGSWLSSVEISCQPIK